MPRTVRLAAAVLIAAVTLSGCGEEEPEVVDVGTRITSAADALECQEGAEPETKPVKAGSPKARESAANAVRAWAERVRRSADLPIDGYQVSIEEVGTVLFTHETESRAEIAVIVARTEDKDGELGWVAQSWAWCRPGGSAS
jgi:hypothetical protein